MYCPECGSQLQPGDRFCVNCGVAIDCDDTVEYSAAENGIVEDVNDQVVDFEPTGAYAVGAEENHSVTNEYPGSQTTYEQTSVSTVKNKKNKKALLIALPVVGVVIVAAVLVLLFVFGGNSAKINLNDYVSVTYEGYDGFGTAVVNFDYERFVLENEKVIKYNSKVDGALSQETDGIPAAFYAENCLQYDLSESTGLSNGSNITLKWNLNPDAEFFFNIRGEILREPKTFSVSGLTTVDKFDAFENVSITLTGTAPYGYVEYEVNNTEDYMQYLEYSVDKSGGLSNGDTVALSVNLTIDAETYVEQYGKLPAASKKTYKITGLPEYIKTVSQISSSSLNQIKNASESAVYQHLYNNTASTERVDNVEYVGNYFQVANENAASDSHNILTMVYRVDLYVDSSFGTYYITYYHPIRYYNISLGVDGECNINLKSYTQSKDRFYPPQLNNYYYYYGYSSIAALHEKLINGNLFAYSYENNIY